jgi:hypothetical protein
MLLIEYDKTGARIKSDSSSSFRIHRELMHGTIVRFPFLPTLTIQPSNTAGTLVLLDPHEFDEAQVCSMPREIEPLTGKSHKEKKEISDALEELFGDSDEEELGFPGLFSSDDEENVFEVFEIQQFVHAEPAEGLQNLFTQASPVQVLSVQYYPTDEGNAVIDFESRRRTIRALTQNYTNLRSLFADRNLLRNDEEVTMLLNGLGHRLVDLTLDNSPRAAADRDERSERNGTMTALEVCSSLKTLRLVNFPCTPSASFLSLSAMQWLETVTLVEAGITPEDATTLNSCMPGTLIEIVPGFLS